MINLMQGDCLQLMQGIPDNSVDMVLCDLPYGTTRCKWDCAIPFEPLWKEYNRVTKSNAAICLFAQAPFDKVLACSNLENFRHEWVWVKGGRSTGFLNASRMPLKCHENILVFYRKLPTYNPQMRDRDLAGNPIQEKAGYVRHNLQIKNSCYNKVTPPHVEKPKGKTRMPIDVINFPMSDGERGLHSTQKPVCLCEYLIKTYTNEGDTVLDNCMGSGSTGVACVNTSRNFIGMELDADYFNMAKKRIYEASNHDS